MGVGNKRSLPYTYIIMNDKKKPDGRAAKRQLRFILLYLVTGAVIATYSITIYTYVRMQIGDNIRINAAGRLRMLTQKITKETLLYRDGIIPRANVVKSTVVFNTTIFGITQGGTVPLDITLKMSSRLTEIDDPECRSLLEKVIQQWIPFQNHVKQYMDRKNPDSLDYILGHNEILMYTIDKTVIAIQKHASRDMRMLGLIIASVILIILILIIATMIRQVQRSRTAETRLAEIEQLLPICSGCKKIRTDNNHPENPRSWTSIDEYLRDKKDMVFTHSICPDCMMKLYPGLFKDEKKND